MIHEVATILFILSVWTDSCFVTRLSGHNPYQLFSMTDLCSVSETAKTAECDFSNVLFNLSRYSEYS